MGIPVFITPVEPDVASKKTEKIAAVMRSSIRRRPLRSSVPSRLGSDARLLRLQGIELRRSQQEGSDPSYAALGGSLALAATIRRSGDTEENRRTRLRALTEQDEVESSLSWVRRHSPEDHLVDNDELLRSLHLRAQMDSRNYADAMERFRAIRRTYSPPVRRHPAPTPPYTDSDNAMAARGARNNASVIPDGRRVPRAAPDSLTPARSPDRVSSSAGASLTSRRTDDYRDTRAVGPLSRHRERSPFDPNGILRDDEDYSSDQGDQSPVSNGNSTRADRLRQAQMDGLGDRDRSLSPESGSAWDTLLTSITPDLQAPSAASSFASSSAVAAAAAATSSSSNSRSAFRNSNDVDVALAMAGSPVTGERFEPYDRDDHTYRIMFPNHGRGNPESRSMFEARVAVEDLEDEQAMMESNARLRSSYAEAARESGGGDDLLDGMQQIISRLAERDDIPESWWASFGLRRENTS